MTRRREHEQPTPVTQTPESAQADADSNADSDADADEPTVGLGFPDRLVLALLDDAKDVLTAVGVRLSVVSLDEDRALFRERAGKSARSASKRRASSAAGSSPRWRAPCRESRVELVELRCGRRSEWPCTFSLEWSQEFAASLAA